MPLDTVPVISGTTRDTGSMDLGKYRFELGTPGVILRRQHQPLAEPFGRLGECKQVAARRARTRVVAIDRVKDARSMTGVGTRGESRARHPRWRSSCAGDGGVGACRLAPGFRIVRAMPPIRDLLLEALDLGDQIVEAE